MVYAQRRTNTLLFHTLQEPLLCKAHTFSRRPTFTVTIHPPPCFALIKKKNGRFHEGSLLILPFFCRCIDNGLVLRWTLCLAVRWAAGCLSSLTRGSKVGGKTSYMAVRLDHTGFTGCLRQTVPHSGRAVGRWLQRVFVGEGEHHGVCLMGRGEDTTFNRHNRYELNN